MRYPSLHDMTEWLSISIGGVCYAKLDPDAVTGVRQIPPEHPDTLEIYSRDSEPLHTDDPALFALFEMTPPCAS